MSFWQSEYDLAYYNVVYAEKEKLFRSCDSPSNIPLRQAKSIRSWHAAHLHKLHTSAHSTHTDLLTSGVPLASLSEKQLEPGDNLIDFILSFLALSEVWRRHFNCSASPLSPNLPLISLLTPASVPESCQRPVAYWCFCMFYVFLEIWQPWHGADFNQLVTYHREWQLGESKKDTHTEKEEEEENWWGCHWLRSAPASSLTEASPPF